MKVRETERLMLRTWRDDDIDQYYHIYQDLKVIKLLHGSLTMQEVKNFFSSMNQQFYNLGYTLWAAEEKEGKLIGFIGLNPPKWDAHFTPCVEIGWRLGSQYWNKGYATEGARAVLEYGFIKCGISEIVSFTVPANIRSIRVMEKIGLKRDINGDFAHPKLPPDHELSKHVLYRAKNPRIKDFTQLCLVARRIKLLPINMKYATDICKNFTVNITKYMWSSAPKSQNDINQHVLIKQQEMQNGKDISLLVLKKDSEEFLGYAAIHEVQSKTPELGIWLKENAHGYHYGYEALTQLKSWAEENLSYEYLKYPVAKQNIPSRKLVESMGGKVEAEYIKTTESGNLLDEVEYRFYKK